jgi:hypothetical protein
MPAPEPDPSEAWFPLTPLPVTPPEITALRLNCKAFAAEISRSTWHSHVEYRFPSTVAFIDILSQWSPSQIASVRRVRVVDSPLPLYPYGGNLCYHTHEFSSALEMFPGLQLDRLTVESPWLEPNGRALDSWAGGAASGSAARLLVTQGWKRLEYVSGILGLMPSQVKQMAKLVEEYRVEKEEPDFDYGLGRIRPQLDPHAFQRQHGGEVEDDKAEVEAWYDARPEEGSPKDFPTDVTELQLSMWAERGQDAKYVVDGTMLAPVIRELVDKVGWLQLRKTNMYLVTDGLDSPEAHL